MQILCLDLEGVLVPEIWQVLAQRTGVEELMRTTRDVPDFGELMALRLEAMERHGLTLSMVREAVASSDPLPGALEFMHWAESVFQIAILSDTFYEIATPLVRKLGNPFLVCHELDLDGDRIVGFRLRQPDPKGTAVRSFQALNKKVYAAGDSFNDLSMLRAADHGYFYVAPAAVRSRAPDMPCVENHQELRTQLEMELRHSHAS